MKGGRGSLLEIARDTKSPPPNVGSSPEPCIYAWANEDKAYMEKLIENRLADVGSRLGG